MRRHQAKTKKKAIKYPGKGKCVLVYSLFHLPPLANRSFIRFYTYIYGEGREVLWVESHVMFLLDRERGREWKAGFSKKQEGICQWDASPSSSSCASFLCIFFLKRPPSFSLSYFRFFTKSPPPLSTLTLLIYTTIYCMFFFALLFVKLSLSFPFILSPYTDAVDPSKPLLLIPLRQLLFQPPSRAVAIQHRLLVHTAFPKSSHSVYIQKKKDGACQSLILS